VTVITKIAITVVAALVVSLPRIVVCIIEAREAKREFCEREIEYHESRRKEAREKAARKNREAEEQEGKLRQLGILRETHRYILLNDGETVCEVVRPYEGAEDESKQM